MRIAILCPIVGDAYGQEKVLRDACRVLSDLGHEILVISEEQEGALPPGARCEVVSPLTGFNVLSDPRVVGHSHAQVMQLLSEFDPEVVHFYDQFDPRLMSAVIDRYPTVFSAHTVAPTCPASTRHVKGSEVCTERSGYRCVWNNREFGCLDFLRTDLHRVHAVQGFRSRRRQLDRMDRIVAISDYVRDTLLRDRFLSKQVFRLYNPVSVDSTLRDTVATIPEHIVCAARLVPLKGVEHVLRAFAQLKHRSARLTVAGEGDQEKELHQLAKDLGLNDRVNWLGKISYTEVQRLMASAEVVVQPNLGPEGFGLTVAEAAALGRPVVGYRVAAFDEVIEHGVTGSLLPPGDVAGLATELDRLMDHPELARTMGERAAGRMQALFSPERHVEGLLKVFESAIHCARARSLSSESDQPTFGVNRPVRAR